MSAKAAQELAEQRRTLRANVRQMLGNVNNEQIAFLAHVMIEQYPDTIPELTVQAPPPPPPAPPISDISEAGLWPKIVEQQAKNALSTDPKVSYQAAMFFARVFKKIESNGGAKPAVKPGADAKPLEPHEEYAALQTRMQELADKFASHNPGEATIVSSGVQTS